MAHGDPRPHVGRCDSARWRGTSPWDWLHKGGLETAKTGMAPGVTKRIQRVKACSMKRGSVTGADFARCWNNQENHTIQTWWNLCLWRPQTNSPSRKQHHPHQSTPIRNCLLWYLYSSWKTLSREAFHIRGMPTTVLILILKSFQRAPASGQTRPS